MPSEYLIAPSTDTTIPISYYLDLVEKTDQQLNWLSALDNIAVGLLAVVIGVLALLVTYAVWKASKDGKEYAQKQIDKLGELIEKQTQAFLESKEKGFEKAHEQYQELIEKHRVELSSLSKEGEARSKESEARKEQLEKLIAQLEESQAILPSVVYPEVIGPLGGVTNVGGYLEFGDKYHKCTNCGYGMKVRSHNPFNNIVPITISSYTLGGTNTITCLKCGNVDAV